MRDLCYSYGDRLALDALSLDVPRGSIFGLLGPNGSGKSTLLSILIDRRPAASGSLSVFGQPLAAKLRARIGIVFQEPSLDPAMTVRETMAMQARMFGMKRARAASETERLLDRVGLLNRAASMTTTLSGGMKRRLELARALLSSPELILLDERRSRSTTGASALLAVVFRDVVAIHGPIVWAEIHWHSACLFRIRQENCLDCLRLINYSRLLRHLRWFNGESPEQLQQHPAPRRSEEG